ncbi:hypothetical protein Bca4012_054870 [Brassica carinata]|uniref:tyrosine--tRNA ligase n=1 Tax=Brassica carinata TaxID=52824 RepID=A0A8X7VVX0_BRACI|nr:hypothetical protein Bca52824_012112 [Brassica carinata]
MNSEKNVEFLWSSSDEINARGDEYWPLVMEIACRNSLSKADICQLGMDQQTVNLLARDYFDETERGNKTFNNFEDIAADYESDQLHPEDLKDALLSKALNKILQSCSNGSIHGNGGSFHQRTFLSCQITVSNLVVVSSVQLLQFLLSNRSIGQECIQEDELKNLLAKKPTPICYDGFEPSGRMHIAQGVMKVTNVNKLTSAGCQVKIWIADWFAQLNNKLGGDLERIKIIGEYFKEIWQAGGMNLEKVTFLWASEEISGRGNKYWPLVMDIARRNNLRRVLRCGQIIGRSETEVLSAAQILYPCMQCADIFLLEADICQLGMDQRKVNMLAREYCDDIKRKNKPIILSHHMLPGLLEGQEKMSKSNPSSVIFMEDDEDAVNEKISKAHCPSRTIAGNPCLEYVKYLVLPRFNEFKVEIDGGDKTFTSFEDIAADYENGELSPEDLKKALIKALNKMLQVSTSLCE